MARAVRLFALSAVATGAAAMDWPYTTMLPNLTDDIALCAKASGFAFANDTLITQAQADAACPIDSCAAAVNAILTRHQTSSTDEDLVGAAIAYSRFAMPVLNYCWYFEIPGNPCPTDPYEKLHGYFREKDAACARQTKLSIFDIAETNALDRWYDFYVSGALCLQECIDLTDRYRLFATNNQILCNGVYNFTDPDVYARGRAQAKYVDFLSKACLDEATVTMNFRYQPGWTLLPTPAPPTPAPTPTTSPRATVSTVQPAPADGSGGSGEGQEAVAEEDGDSIVETAGGLPKSSTRRPLGTSKPQTLSGQTISPSSEPPSANGDTSQPDSSVVVSSGGSARTKSNASQAFNQFSAETTPEPPAALHTPESTTNNGWKQALPVMIAVAICALFVVMKRQRDRKSKPAQPLNEDTYSALTDSQVGSQLSHAGGLVASEAGEEIFLPKPMPIESIQDIRIIGSGGHGVVYLVRDTTNDRLLASKRLAKNHQTSDRISEFLAEIQLVSTLDHPNIVAFVGTSSMHHTNMHVLFEYMDGGDLRQYLDQSPVTPWNSLKLRIAMDIAEALTYVHSAEPAPIVHRDLKSRNVLLMRSLMGAKLTDFGVARRLSQNCSMTTGVGTGRWLAPEVITGGGDYTTACDIYSFGVVLSELDTHEVPFGNLASKDETALPEITILTMVALQGLQPTISESCPPAIADIMKACLSFDPQQRPKAEEVLVLLREARNRLGLN